MGAGVIAETLAVRTGLVEAVAAVGTKGTGLSLKVFIDNNLLSAGTAKLRVYQLSPDGGAITVSTQGSTLLSGINYQGASNYLPISLRAYTFHVTSATHNSPLPIHPPPTTNP